MTEGATSKFDTYFATLDVRGVGLCCVVRVHRHGKKVRVDVERATDLKPRSFDLHRKQFKRVER